jgi:hypothetical protein
MKPFVIILTSILLFLTGCEAPGVNFSDIVKGDVKKIIAKTERESSGFYSTNDNEMINLFLGKMESMPFNKTDESSSVFETRLELYDGNNKKIGTLIFTGKNIAKLNGKTYKVDEAKLKQFTDVFFTNKYLKSDSDKAAGKVAESAVKVVKKYFEFTSNGDYKSAWELIHSDERNHPSQSMGKILKNDFFAFQGIKGPELISARFVKMLETYKPIPTQVTVKNVAVVKVELSNGITKKVHLNQDKNGNWRLYWMNDERGLV